MTTYWLEQAWLGGDHLDHGVLVEVDGGTFSRVETGVERPPTGSEVMSGISIPGMANTHSHVFHRALRARTQATKGSFWSWRDEMYRVANRLDPDSYHAMATAVFGEMLLAGITTVGEFHYVHHHPDGSRYDDPNEMGKVLIAAASEAGIRLTLLNTCYLQGGLHADGHDPLRPEQVRFGDGDVSAFLDRITGLDGTQTARLGTAIHSVRAVQPEDIERIGYATEGPLHIHLSEQPEENEQCLAAFDRSPTQLLADAGILGDRLTAVHGTHLTIHDIALLGDSRSGVCVCPTTERDLADGIGPASALRSAGSPLSLGTDSHAIVDMFEEARAMELDERLASNVRGIHSPADLLTSATFGGHAALGWKGDGQIAPGAAADFVTVGRDSVRMSGTNGVESLVFAATAADVTDVVVAGRRVVRDGAHISMDVAHALQLAVAGVVG